MSSLMHTIKDEFLVEYSNETKGFCFYNLVSHTIIISGDVNL